MPDPVSYQTIDYSKVPLCSFAGTSSLKGIPCYELAEGCRENLSSQNGGNIQRMFLVRWADRFNFANLCLGFGTLSGGRGGSVKYTLPLFHPEATNLYAVDINMVPIGAPTTGPFGLAFPFVKATISFGTLPYNGPEQDNSGNSIDDSIAQQVFVSQDVEIGGETVELPGSARFIDVTPTLPKAQNSTGSMFVPHSTLRTSFAKVPYMPTYFLDYVGCVNDDVFAGFAKGKVRFEGASIHRETNSYGTTQTLVLTHICRPAADWNYVLNPMPLSGGDLWVPEYVKSNGAGSVNGKIWKYPYKDMSKSLLSITTG